MPQLKWASKTTPKPVPGFLMDDSLVYPPSAAENDGTLENRLIHGDNLAIMSALLADYEGRLHLIYADPPSASPPVPLSIG